MVSDTPRLALDAWRVTGRFTQHYRLHVQEGKFNEVSKQLMEAFFVLREETNMGCKSVEGLCRIESRYYLARCERILM